MANKKPLDRYVEAGKEFTEASRRCLEGIAHDPRSARASPAASMQKTGPRSWSNGAGEQPSSSASSCAKRFGTRSSSSTWRRTRT